MEKSSRRRRTVQKKRLVCKIPYHITQHILKHLKEKLLIISTDTSNTWVMVYSFGVISTEMRLVRYLVKCKKRQNMCVPGRRLGWYKEGRGRVSPGRVFVSETLCVQGGPACPTHQLTRLTYCKPATCQSAARVAQVNKYPRRLQRWILRAIYPPW